MKSLTKSIRRKMNSLMWNIIELNVLILLVFTGYLGIKKYISIQQQRIALYLVCLLPILFIYLKLNVDLSSITYVVPLVELDPVTVFADNQVVAISKAHDLVWMCYLIGLVVFGIILVYRLLKVLFLFRGKDYAEEGNVKIYQIQGLDSFSFFNRIQLATGLSDEDQEIVLEHERLHVKRMHSFDLIFTELFHVLFWFNPIFFFVKREFVNLHEYDVDALMYQKHKVNYLRFLVNYALRLNHSTYLLTSSFYDQLTLKKRITQMKTQTKKRTWLLTVLPTLALTILLFQCTKPVDTLAEIESETQLSEEQPAMEKIFDKVDVEPEFKGGAEAMNAFIGQNIAYPEEAKINGEQGIVYVSFVISNEGNVKDVAVSRGVTASLDAEAIRVINLMPKWKPGELDGEKVSVKYVLPINYKLD